MQQNIHIPTGKVVLPGELAVPGGARGMVVFAHGSGSSRLSPRNQFVASALRRSGRVGTLLFDLLTSAEDHEYENRFNIDLLADRLVDAANHLLGMPALAGMGLGFFGASTGAAAAIIAATRMPRWAQAVVSRGGRPDLAEAALDRLMVPTLLIVGGHDYQVIELNEHALERVPTAHKKLEIVPGATHLFEEPGALETVAELSRAWFDRFLEIRT